MARTLCRALFALVVALGVATPALALTGRLVDAQSGKPIAGAELAIVGLQGTVRTDADGRFTWTPDPRPPFSVIVVLPDGRLARTITVSTVEPGKELTLKVQSALAEEITVAAGAAPSINASPGAATTLVTARDIGMRQPANLQQAIENVPGVNQVSEGQAAVPAVRGLARGRTLLLIDGSRVSSERRVGPSATFLDPSMIEAVDVARGPGSVAYGSDSFGGVISVRTKRPSFSGMSVDGSVTIGGGIPDRRGDFTYSRGFGGKGGILLAVHGRGVEDYEGPNSAILNSGYGDSGFLLRADHNLSGGLFSASWQTDFGRDIERPRNNSNSVRVYYPFEDSHRFNAGWERPNVWGQGLFKVSGFFGTIEQRTDQDRIPTPSGARDIARADISANDFQVRSSLQTVKKRTRLELGADINGRTGLEAHDILIQYDLAGNIVSNSDTASVEDAGRTDTGLFIQADHGFNSWLAASGGGRYDYVRNVNNGGFFGNMTVTHGAGSGFGALTAGPFHSASFTVQVSRGFRDPTLSDRFFRGPSGRGFITGNPDLDPETSLQWDLGARYTTERVRAGFFYYHYEIENLIERYQTEPDFFFFRNRGLAQIEGIELEVQAALGAGFSAELGAQRGRGVLTDDGTDLDDISTDMLSLVIRKTFGQKISTFFQVAHFAGDDRPGPNEIVSPRHTKLDLGATWALHRHFEVNGAIRNLLNEEYYASPDPRFVLAPAINGFVTLRLKF